MNDGSEASSYSSSNANALVDNVAYTYSRFSTPSSDALLEQCYASSTWNMRYHRFDTLSVTPGMTRPDMSGSDHWDTGSYFQGLADSVDPSRDYLHVFFTNQLNNNFSTIGLAYYGKNLVWIRDNLSQVSTAQVLAHEFGHSRRLGHSGDSGSDATIH